MMKKLLISFIFILSSFLVHAQLTITTTSTSSTWSPIAVTNSGATLSWSASGGGITPVVINADDPTFDFSANTGTVTVTITSSDSFVGLTNFRFSASDIQSADIDDATNLQNFFMYSGGLTSINLDQNTNLTRVNLQSNDLTAIDVSANTLLDELRLNFNDISTIDITNNPALLDLELRGNDLPTAILDQVVNDVDGFGTSNGNLEISNNPGSLTSASLTAYNNLVSRGWTIDVAAPVDDTEAPVIGTLNPATNLLSTSLTLTWTAATDNVGVTNYRVFQDGALLTTLGNVLTFDVTGLTPSTTYDFYITALDNEGNESSQSNTIQATTLAPGGGGSTMVITTTSTSATWSPLAVTNSGDVLEWSASGGGITPQVIVANDPTFDFSGNTGTVTVTVNSSDNFAGLTNLRFNASNISSADVANALLLNTFFMYSNDLTSIDLSTNANLNRVNLQSNDLTALDVSGNPNLTELRLNTNDLANFSITNNSALTNLELRGNALPTADLDQIVNDLDAFGLSNGNLEISNNTGALTSASATAYNNLISRGWTIDVAAPVEDNEPPVIGTLNPATNILPTSLTLSWTAATDNIGVTNYNIFQDGSLLTTVGNVLTFNVTGLTESTSYDFYITALDNAGNESGQSNTIQATTLSGGAGGDTMTLTTTSTSATWSPLAVTNSGDVLEWSATGGGITPQTIVANDPVFDFSGNTGTVTVTITGSDNFVGLTNLRFNASDIETADIANGLLLNTFFMYSNNLTAIDLSSNVNLSRLNLQSNDLTALDISGNTGLTDVVLNTNDIASFSVTNNSGLTNLELRGNDLTAADLDQILNDLDGFGLSNGNLEIANNLEDLTTSSFAAYTNLVNRGWTIDVPAPAPDTEPPVIGTLNPATNILQTSLTLTWTAATDNVAVTNYNVFQDGALIATVGDVLTYDVTGLTADTTYDFYITALDGVGNESAQSNTIQATTLAPGAGVTITFTTTSTSATWSPLAVTNSGNTLEWNASGGGITPQTVTADLPTFDLSANTGTVTVVATSTDNFVGLTNLRFSSVDIQTADVDNATALNTLFLFSGNLATLNVAANTALERLNLQSNVLTALDISTNTQLNELRLNTNQLTTLSITNNALLTDVQVRGNQLPTADLNQLVIDLDNFGLSNGNLEISNNAGALNSSALAAYNSLIGKGWTIDVAAPVPDNEAPVIGTLNPATNVTQTSLTLTWTAATDNVGVTNYSIFQDGALVETIGNVLTYDVTGLTANTTYDFYITALDNEGNESDDSNTIQATTLNPGGNTITFTTTSTSNAWSPLAVTNSGATLEWSASGGGITPQVIVDDNPTFDFSANTGTVTVVVTSSDNFIGLTNLRFSSVDLETADVANAVALNTLFLFSGNLGTIDVSTNTQLQRLNLQSNVLTALDVSTNTQLTELRLNTNDIAALSITNNTLLTNLQVRGNALTTADLDQILLDLDAFGQLNGTLQIASNAEELSSDSFTAYNNLIGKGWTIDVDAPLPPGPQINITGNGLDITSSASPIEDNGTAFGETTIGSPITNQFVIENIGTENLVITFVGSSNPVDFSVTQPANTVIAPGGSETIDVTFNPTTLGSKVGSIIITSNDADTAAFVMNISGDAVEVLSNQIMISQYYQGFSGTDNWIEVSNISGAPLPADTYFLILFDESSARTGIIETAFPDASTPIPALGVGETVLFRNTAAALPGPGNIGGATQIVSDVCTFNGDDVILISTTEDDTAYNFRVDIMGNISPDAGTAPEGWGTNDSYIKGGCSSEEAHKTFDLNDWTFILLEDVDAADPNRNVALGTQVVGPTEFDGVSWSNLEPDQSRTAIISSSFTGAANTFTACNLTISAGADVVFDSNGATSNSIVIYGDLIVDGSLTIGDTESLVAYDPDASLGTITKIENSTPLDDINDNTYWASPVVGSQIGTVFPGVRTDRIFEFRAGETNPIYAGTNFKYWWNKPSGAMERARGYAVPGASLGVQTITFTGVPYNGPFTLNAFFSGTVDTGDANENFNLIGNPYPAAIDILRILEDNGSVNEVALWTHGTTVDPDTGEYDPGDYVFYSTTGSTTPGVTENIGSSQGFMIRTVTGGGIAFNDSYKLVGRNDQFYKAGPNTKNTRPNDKDRIWLRMRSEGEKNDILLGFLEEATDGYDTYYDATGNLYSDNISLIEKNFKFYSKIGQEKFVIQGLGIYNDARTITLGFDAKKAGTHKISIADTEGELNNAQVYLYDNVLKVTHDLKRSAYEFYEAEAGSYADRFTLRFTDEEAILGLDDLRDSALFSISNKLDIMNVNSGRMVEEIRVYDLLGRLVIQANPRSKNFELNTATIRTGTLMVIEARMEDGSLINKKSIKY